MKAAVIVFPGSNCDRDLSVALESVTGAKPHMVWHRDTELPDVDLIAVPGGFTYGDYLRAGAMASHSPVMREVVARANRGVRVLGVCNGFQVLTEARLLPGALMRNAGLKYACRTVGLRVERADSAFTAGYRAGEVIRIPIAHHDGNFFADDETLDRIEGEGRVAFRYVDPDGEPTAEANPNGSARNIAGILNDSGNVLGMMPHPERAVESLLGTDHGVGLFRSVAEYLAQVPV